MTTMQAETRTPGKARLLIATGATALALALMAAIGLQRDTTSRRATSTTTAVAETAVAAAAGTNKPTASGLVIYITASDEAATALRSELDQARMHLGGLGPPPATLVLVAGSLEAENLAGLPLPPGTHVFDTRGGTAMGVGW